MANIMGNKYPLSRWIAYPDTRGAMDYFVVAYAPATYSTQFAVVALEDDTTVSVTYQGGARGDLAGDSFTLQKYQSLQIQVCRAFGQCSEVLENTAIQRIERHARICHVDIIPIHVPPTC